MEFLNTLFSKSMDGNFLLFLMPLSFIGGVIASVSPCSLGFLPVLTGYIVGTKDNKKNIYIQLLSFLLGLSLTVTIFGVIAALAGKVLGFYNNDILIIIFSSLLLVLGLNILQVLEIPIPTIIKKMPEKKGNSLFIFPLLIGIIYALTASPCSTPILASIMAFSSLKSNILLGAGMLFSYSLGQSVILFVAGSAVAAMKKSKSFHSFSGVLNKGFGIILIIFSAILYSRVFGLI
ncbi:MAG: cytochrome c biogenesis protein CcdA [bacterium]